MLRTKPGKCAGPPRHTFLTANQATLPSGRVNRVLLSAPIDRLKGLLYSCFLGQKFKVNRSDYTDYKIKQFWNVISLNEFLKEL